MSTWTIRERYKTLTAFCPDAKYVVQVSLAPSVADGVEMLKSILCKHERADPELKIEYDADLQKLLAEPPK